MPMHMYTSYPGFRNLDLKKPGPGPCFEKFENDSKYVYRNWDTVTCKQLIKVSGHYQPYM